MPSSDQPPRKPTISQPPQHQTDVVVEVRPERLVAKPPPMYQVVLLNDDFTPMEFVVIVLQEFFGKNSLALRANNLKSNFYNITRRYFFYYSAQR